jgi:acyl carrier protein
LFSERLGLEVPDQDMDLLTGGLVDSLAFVELLLAVEQEFGVEIDINELELDDFRSIARIASLVARLPPLRAPDEAATT